MRFATIIIQAPPTVPGSEASTVAPKPIPRSLDSFKVLTECPIIIALLFQLHKKYVGVNVPALVPLIVKVRPLSYSEKLFKALTRIFIGH